jgi:hypothetical protein
MENFIPTISSGLTTTLLFTETLIVSGITSWVYLPLWLVRHEFCCDDCYNQKCLFLGLIIQENRTRTALQVNIYLQLLCIFTYYITLILIYVAIIILLAAYIALKYSHILKLFQRQIFVLFNKPRFG